MAILLGGALYVWHLRATHERLAPPEGAKELHAFLLQMPRPDRAYELRVGDARYVELVGPLPPTFTLPSGPPAYVFDESRQLVDWTADQGDDPGFTSRWHASGRRELTTIEMTELLEDR